MWTGNNDYFLRLNDLPTRPQQQRALVEATVGSLSDALTTLASLGAGNILVPNLADLSDTPLGRSTSPRSQNTLSQIIRRHNQRLSRELRRLSRQFSETNFIAFDVNALLNDATNRPEKFGLTNVTESCTNINLYQPPSILDPSQLTICNSPETYLFWDSVHPTKTAHKIVADSALVTLASELESELTTASAIELASVPLAVSAETDEDILSGARSVSGDRISVPEPNATMGLIAFGTLGGLCAWRLRKTTVR
ncbi:MAG: SGNH/GDSL hydrolase family protein [Hydrococcus sp. C42_A2020_068]|nr:SGNH/GDSL hydrolase family protein [Hydrococcus sp. C42_A2020_068]